MLPIQSSALVPFIPACAKEILGEISTLSSVYSELTRRIPEEEFVEIEKKMFELSPCDQKHFMELVERGDLSSIVQLKDYPLHALYAVKAEKITLEEFATITFAYASPDENKTCIKIFDANGRVNPEARDLIKQTLSLNTPMQSFGHLLTDQELDSFFKEMAKLSPLQQQFFLEESRPQTEFGTIKFMGMEFTTQISTVRTAIETQYAGLNIFSKCTEKEEAKFMIPSSGMMQAFLNVKFKGNSVRMNFVLGLSSVEDIINNGLTATRDAALRFPGISLPVTADMLPAQWTDFTYHDFFHAIVVSCATATTRKEMISLARSIQKIANPEFYNFIIDLEMGGHYFVNVIFKENIPEYSKLLMDLDMRIGTGVIVDSSLRTASYKDRILYNLAEALEPKFEELQEYKKWGESFSQKQLKKNEDKREQLKSAVSEIEEELSEVNLKVEHLQTQQAAFETVLSTCNFTEMTIKELEDEKMKLEKTEEENKSTAIVLKSVSEELDDWYRKFSMAAVQAGAQIKMSDQAAINRIINILANNCFKEPELGMCFSNNTMTEFEPLSERATLNPENVLTGIIVLLVLRMFFRKVNM